MNIAEDFVRRLAAVECDEWKHPTWPERHYPRNLAVAPSAGIRDMWFADKSPESIAADEAIKKDRRERCPFCIARATLREACFYK